MPWKKVENYHLGYNISNKQFLFYYKLEGEAGVHQIFPSPAELLALSDMFRNEGPINFETTGKYFASGPEPIGEGET